MMDLFLKSFVTGAGRGGGGGGSFHFLHRDIPFIIADIKLGTVLFCSTQLMRTFFIFLVFHILSDTEKWG